MNHDPAEGQCWIVIHLKHFSYKTCPVPTNEDKLVSSNAPFLFLYQCLLECRENYEMDFTIIETVYVFVIILFSVTHSWCGLSSIVNKRI